MTHGSTSLSQAKGTLHVVFRHIKSGEMYFFSHLKQKTILGLEGYWAPHQENKLFLALGSTEPKDIAFKQHDIICTVLLLE